MDAEVGNIASAESQPDMPWTRKEVKFLLSKGSPLTKGQKSNMVGELHHNPSMGHAKKGSKALKRSK